MKVWIWMLAAVLLLSGCAGKEPESTQTDPPGLYDPSHSVSVDSDGALRSYPLGELSYRTLVRMGEDYLLFGEDSLTLLSGENLTPVTTVAAPGLPLPESGQVQVNDKGVCYFSSQENTVVFLGNTLLEVGRLHLTEVISGNACVDPQWNRLYYCDDEHIRVLDLQTGTSQTIKTLSGTGHRLTGIAMEGAYLCCVTDNANGTETYQLIRTENGETVYRQTAEYDIMSTGERYAFRMRMGSLRAYIFGEGEKVPQSLFFPAEEQVYPLVEDNALVHLTQSENALTMEYYSMTSGKKVGILTLPDTDAVTGICAGEGSVWFAHDGTLYQWDPESTPAYDQTVYARPFHTRTEPDKLGLTQLQALVSEIEESWSVDILWQEEPTAFVPWESYSYETEFVLQVYRQGLTELRQAMSLFPQDFFTRATQWTGEKLQIALVRGIHGQSSQGTLASASSIQYQLDGKAYLAIALWGDVERAFYHGVSHLIETRILSTCTAYYEWNTLNPEGFRYDNDYIANQLREDEQYLQPENRYFIDMYSMSFAIEDRARILEYACLPGNEAYFTSPTMAEKLRRICTGIRKAFELTGESYQWEQYLPQ